MSSKAVRRSALRGWTSRAKCARAGKRSGSAPRTAARNSSRPCSRSSGVTVPMPGQARRAQGLQHLLHDQAGSGAAGGVPAPHRGELRLPGEGVPDAQGEGGEAITPAALGAVALHGGEQGAVGDGAQQAFPALAETGPESLEELRFTRFDPVELIGMGVAAPEAGVPGGTPGVYSFINYLLLGQLLEKVTGLPAERCIAPSTSSSRRDCGTPDSPSERTSGRRTRGSTRPGSA